MKQQSLLVVIVNYKKNISEIEIINNKVFPKKNFQIMLWDNLPTQDNLEQADNYNIDFYYPCYINQSMSKIYNYAINKHKNNVDYFIFFDNDTLVDEKYVKKLLFLITKFPSIELFLPVIKSHKKIISPAKLYFTFGFAFKNLQEGIYKSKNISAINSGMIIKSKYFKNTNFLYDPNLGFYCTDTYFMKKYAKENKHLYIFTTEISHDLSLFNDESMQRVRFRFFDFKKGLKIIYQDNFFLSILCKLFLFYLTVKKSIKYKHNFFQRTN